MHRAAGLVLVDSSRAADLARYELGGIPDPSNQQLLTTRQCVIEHYRAVLEELFSVHDRYLATNLILTFPKGFTRRHPHLSPGGRTLNSDRHMLRHNG